MKKLVLGMSVATALSGCMALGPTGISPEMHADFVTAASTIGCVLRDESHYQPVELQAGLTRAQTLALVQHHLTWGTAEQLPGDGGVRIKTGACA